MGLTDNNIGTKFHADGSVRFFPGNTVISMIDHDAPVFQEFQSIRAMLAAKPAARCVTMLPDDSIHMTVIEGVCDQWRLPEKWPRELALDCPLSQVDDLFEQRFASVRPLGRVNMQMRDVTHHNGILLHVVPQTDADAQELKRYRDEVSDAFGLRFPNHDIYRFHISICYYTKEPTPEELAQFEEFYREADAYIASHDIRFTVCPPRLTFFDNMFRFNPYRIPRREEGARP